MTKIIRACIALVSLTFTSALFGWTANVGISVSSGQSVDVQITSSVNDGFWYLYDSSNQLVAEGYHYYPSYDWGDGYLEGSSVSISGGVATISGLDGGEYRLQFDSTEGIAEPVVWGDEYSGWVEFGGGYVTSYYNVY
jgi:hypothetical protein